jgi:hypothetical protein
VLTQNTPRICRHLRGKLFDQRLARAASYQRSRRGDQKLKTLIGTILCPGFVSQAEKWAQSLTMDQKR